MLEFTLGKILYKITRLDGSNLLVSRYEYTDRGKAKDRYYWKDIGYFQTVTGAFQHILNRADRACITSEEGQSMYQIIKMHTAMHTELLEVCKSITIGEES